MTLSSVAHLVLHGVVPLFVAWFFFRDRWQRAALIMIATMVVDLDHLFANPLYDPQRCSIGFHPLHTVPVFFIYGLLTLPKQTRLIGIGLLIHMALDGIDCGVMRMTLL
jgi:hypothetical protein